MDLKPIIKANKPNISSSSIDTYLSNIRSTGRQTNLTFNSIKDITDNAKTILESMKDLKTHTRKTKLASFVVALDGKDQSKTVKDTLALFREKMNIDLDTIKEKDTNQELTDTQKNNFVPWNDVLKLFKEIEIEAQPLLKLKSLTYKNLQKLTDYILLGLYTQIPPRRALDYTAFKIRNIDEATDNFLKIKKHSYKLVFNRYKNSARLGPQVIDLPSSFGKVLKKFADKNPYDHLIVNKLGKPVLQSHVTKILNRLFDKHTSVSLLRHSFLTEKFGNVNLKDLEQVTHDIGNKEIARSLKYVSAAHAGGDSST